jgi:hypothetical protein
VVDAISGRSVACFAFESIGSVGVEPATWHPRFGETVASQRIVLAWTGRLPMDHETQVVWDDQ